MLSPAIIAFWNTARQTVPSLPPMIAGAIDADIWFFGDSQDLSMSLAELVLNGPKRATTGLIAEMAADNAALPRPGGLSLVTDFHGMPLMILRSTHVETLSFNQVDADFAAAEGEGDGSLRYWQDAHERYFKRSCQRIGIEWRPDLPVVCERFDVLYPAR
jgi:uncharacterized protein YhfF